MRKSEPTEVNLLFSLVQGEGEGLLLVFSNVKKSMDISSA